MGVRRDQAQPARYASHTEPAGQVDTSSARASVRPARPARRDGVAVSAGTPARVAQRRSTRVRIAWGQAAKLVASRLGRRLGGQVGLGDRVERVEIGLRERRGAGQGLGHPALQDLLEERQHLEFATAPAGSAVAVGRVVPRSRPSAAQAAAVVDRRTPRNGRR